jgi:hypothetical protein
LPQLVDVPCLAGKRDGALGGRMKRTLLVAVLSLAAMTAGPAGAKEAHEVKHKRPICEETYILHLGARLGQDEGNRFVEDDPREAGSAVYYANGK